MTASIKMFNSKDNFKKRLLQYKKEATTSRITLRGSQAELWGKITEIGDDYIEVSDGKMLCSIPIEVIATAAATFGFVQSNLSVGRPDAPPAPPREVVPTIHDPIISQDEAKEKRLRELINLLK